MSERGQRFTFPPAFLWGAATASHQVEGDNVLNDWWEYEQAGRLPYRSGHACRHFELYESDFELARGWGHNAHRLSIEWSRIEPEAGRFDSAALDHYARVVAALLARGLEPIVTLHHFTNPAWFARRGGWARRDSVTLFCRYVGHVLSRLAGQVRYWVTINEPTVYVMRGYIMGNWPPCRPGSWLQGARVLRNLCRAHAAAYQVIHARRADAMVGFAHSAPFIVPRNPEHRADRYVVRVRDFLLNDLCFRLLGREPRRMLDFIGINYYVRQVIAWQPRGVGLIFGREYKHAESVDARRFSSLGWEMYPDGLRAMLERFSTYGVPLIVTENGIATTDETLRTDFIVAHLRALEEALRAGVDVRGYLYWTLFDNFEWTEGFSAHFGLAAVEPGTLARVARPAAALFESLGRSSEIVGRDPPG